MNDQKKKHGAKIKIATVRVGDGDSAAEIKKAKLGGGHGIIAKDKSGKLLTTVDGHNYGEERVVKVVKQILAAKK